MTDDDKTDPIMPDEIVLRNRIAALFNDLLVENGRPRSAVIPWDEASKVRYDVMEMVEEALHDAYGQLALAQKERDETKADRDRLSARVALLDRLLAANGVSASYGAGMRITFWFNHDHGEDVSIVGDINAERDFLATQKDNTDG